MKKYLKRWNKLTEDEKIMFFCFYMGTENMCSGCVNLDSEDCNLCKTMFPEAGYPKMCPCNLYGLKIIKEHPASVIEYCLIHDGWIEKED